MNFTFFLVAVEVKPRTDFSGYIVEMQAATSKLALKHERNTPKNSCHRLDQNMLYTNENMHF